MRKYLISGAVLAFAAMPAYAQTTVRTDTTVTVEYSRAKNRVETAPFKANWFIGVDGGAQIYFGEHDKQAKFGDRLAPALNVYVGKWFTPIVGARLNYSGIGQRGATQDGIHGLSDALPGKGGAPYWLNKQKFNFFNLHADLLINLSNAICGYKEGGHIYNCSPFIGLGWGMVYSEEPKTHEITANAGINNAFKLCSGLDLNINIGAFLVNEDFDGETGDNWGEGNLSATIGLAYKFKPRGWGRTKTVTRVETYDVTGYEKALADAQTEKARLEKEIAELRSQGSDKVIEKVNNIAAPYYVTFELGKSELSKEARVNLGMLAEIIKANNIKFTVNGYADAATGNKKINDKLSKDRAQAVYDCLVKEFGVPESLLEMNSNGGVENMFYNDPALSRAVIAKAE